jgi:hypothetical protein
MPLAHNGLPARAPHAQGINAGIADWMVVVGDKLRTAVNLMEVRLASRWTSTRATFFVCPRGNALHASIGDGRCKGKECLNYSLFSKN